MASIAFQYIDTFQYPGQDDSIYMKATWNLPADGLMKACDSVRQQNLMWGVYLYLFVFFLHAIDIYNASIVIFLKDKQDVLQGISRLDYFVKVSVFQLYKDKLM